jgi:hypothetical protein
MSDYQVTDSIARHWIDGAWWVGSAQELRQCAARTPVRKLGISWIGGYPRRAASIVAMSIFFIGIMAEKARFASAPPAARASVRARGVICQDKPQRSVHQPH